MEMVDILNTLFKLWTFDVDIGCVACFGSCSFYVALCKFHYLINSAITARQHVFV